MNDLLSKLMAKKGADDGMDDDYKNSKLSVLQALKDEMTKMMGGDLAGAGLKKVTVAAPDQAGLKDGLQHAQELMNKGEVLDDDSHEGELDDGDEADHEHEADDDGEEGAGEGDGGAHVDVDNMSPDEAKALLKQLLGK